MKRNFHNGLLLFLVLGLCFLISIETGEAANFCVNTSAQLQDALTRAATNNQNDVIQVVQGTYTGSFFYSSNESYSLSLEGGYASGCTSRQVNAANTVLDAGGSGTVLSLQNPYVVNFIIDAFTFQNGGNSGIRVSAAEAAFLLTNSAVQNNAASGNGGGANIVAKNIDLRNNSFIFNTAAYGGRVNIEYDNAQIVNLFDNFISENITVSGEGGGVHIKWGSPTVTFINNVISKNATTIYIGGGHGGGAHISTYGPVNFINNTVVGNTANLACCWGGGITIYYASYANVYNNIFWGNNGKTGRDIAFYSISESNISLLYNDIDQTPGGVYGLTNFQSSNLNKENPLFIDSTNKDYRLQFESPCIDNGTNVAPGLPATDKDGNLRIANGIVDMGAYEYSININILPDDDSNTINLRRTKKISVAILSTLDFNAPSMVDPLSLTFGPTGDEASPISCATRKPKDVSGDGLKDLVCEFPTKDAGFKCEDTVGILEGKTVSPAGRSFEGKQAVVITPCK